MRIIPQLSVFVKNTKGALEYITNILNKSGVNIVAISTHDAYEYGVVRLIVNDPNRAEQELRNANVLGVIKSDILEVELLDEPGELHNALRKLADNGVNVGHVCATSGKGKAIIYIACNDLQKALETLS